MSEELQGKIRERAFELWEASGRTEGREWEHWLEAERQVMAEEGLGEPAGDQPQPAPEDRPEPQPEIPADPLRNPEQVRSTAGPEYPPATGPQEMPADRGGPAEMPADPGIAEIPAAPATKQARGKAAAGSPKPAEAPAGPVTKPATVAGKRGRAGKTKE